MANTSLKASCINTYSKLDRNQNPIDVFVYKITGTKSALARYEELQGDNYREDEETGDVLFFSTRYFGESGNIIITANDKIAPDLSAVKKQASLVNQFGGQIGEALAQKIADQLLGVKATTPPAETPVVTESEDEAEEEIVDEAEESEVEENMEEDADFNP